MNIRSYRHLLAATAVGLAGLGIAAGHVAANPQIPTATKDVFRYQVGNVHLSPSGGTNTAVMTVNLPAGDWVIDTMVDAVNFGAPDFIRCAPFNGPTQIQGGSTIWAGSGVDTVGELSNKVAVNSPGAALAITLQRSHDSANGASTYMESGALWAHKSTAAIDIAPA
jgi:hypothetical protein